MIPPTVHIIDDDASYRRSLINLLGASGYRAVGYESGSDFLERLPGKGPGCILLDLQMPVLGGLEMQEKLAAAVPLLPVLFLSGHGDIESTVRAIKGGAEDFLEKRAETSRLLAAIERALGRYGALASQHDRMAEQKARVDSLTAREAEVFNLIIRGKRNKQVAFDLGTSERTVKAHRKSIMDKLEVRSFAEAVSIAERLGLIGASTMAPEDSSGRRQRGHTLTGAPPAPLPKGQ